jgi:hypothetical protein
VAFEDGAINYLGLPAVEIGLRHREGPLLVTIGRAFAANIARCPLLRCRRALFTLSA